MAGTFIRLPSVLDVCRNDLKKYQGKLIPLLAVAPPLSLLHGMITRKHIYIFPGHDLFNNTRYYLPQSYGSKVCARKAGIKKSQKANGYRSRETVGGSFSLRNVKKDSYFRHSISLLSSTRNYEVGDIARFASARQFCSYARVVPDLAQSGDMILRGRGTKQGNPHLKWAFNRVAAISVRHYGYARRFRQKHLARRCSKAGRLISLSIVAHKLAIAAYHVLRNEVPFNKELMFGKTS